MPTIGPLSPTTTTVSGSGTAWSNTANITSSNDTYATVNLIGTNSEFLWARGFGFTVPTGATIDGVLVEAELKSSGTSTSLNYASLVHAGAGLGLAKLADSTLTTSDVYYSRGGASDVWGATLTPAIINDSTFGAFIRVGTANVRTVSADHIRITVTYSAVTYTRTVSATASVTAGGNRDVNPNAALSQAGVQRTSNPTASLSDATSHTDSPTTRQRPRAIDLITVSIYRPLGQYTNGTRHPLDYLNIDPSLTAVSWSSTLPGGWSDALFGIAHPNHNDRYGEPPRRPWLPREMAWGPFHHVEITRHGRVLYAGRMGALQRSYGVMTGFTAQGYGMVATSDMYYRNTDATVVSSGILLRAMIAASAPHLVAAPNGDNWQDPGVAHAYNEFNRMYLGDVLDQIAGEGDSAGNLVDWAVFEDQMVQLRVRTTPLVADYQVPWSLVPDYNEDATGIIGVASFETEAGPSVTDYTAPDFAGDHGFQRGELLQLGNITDAAAVAMTKAYLGQYSQPVISAAIEAGPDDRLEAPGGRAMPRDEVRSGQWIQIEGMERPLVIMSADYDAFSDVARMTAGEWLPDFATLLASLQKDRLKAQRGLNPRGGRKR